MQEYKSIYKEEKNSINELALLLHSYKGKIGLIRNRSKDKYLINLFAVKVDFANENKCILKNKYCAIEILYKKIKSIDIDERELIITINFDDEYFIIDFS